ncbi:MAG: ABC transporter ATP-binding protein/permease [Cyanobacteria bacterium P01_H01_bin.121]
MWQFWRLTQPLRDISHKGRLPALWILLILVAIASSSVLVLESIQRGEFISALAAQDGLRFRQSLLTFSGILVLSGLLLSFSAYIRDTLGLQWRRALTRSYLERYLDQRHYYQLTNQTQIDNPDQRLAEDIRNLCQTAMAVVVIVLESVVQLIGFTGTLWLVSRSLTGILWGYALLATGVTIGIFGKRLTRINAEQLKREANFRFGLIQVREQAEAIAFYRGQRQERKQLDQQFVSLVQNFRRFIRWQFGLDFFQNGYQYLTFIVPSIVLAPRILAGELEIGTIVQSQAAFDRIWLALSLVVIQFEQITALAASVERLNRLAQTLDKLQVAPSQPQIERRRSNQLALQNLTLLTPDHQRVLVRQLSLTVPQVSSLLIMGSSGVGKSSLLRAIAGLWYTGHGVISTPPMTDLLFLPQQPYMMLGSLRQQLLYPAQGSGIEDSGVTDQQLITILQQVQLEKLATQSLDSVVDWSQQLSLGEQQRLAFARLMLQRPTYAILDEATSALSVQQEQQLYEQLVQTRIALISVGHRPSLRLYHQQLLTINPNQTWTLDSAQEFTQDPTLSQL